MNDILDDIKFHRIGNYVGPAIREKKMVSGVHFHVHAFNWFLNI